MVAVAVDWTGLNEARAAFDKLADSSLKGDLLGMIGVLGESQTKRRISDEKKAPSGEAWKPWSKEYAATRGPEKSLLIDEDWMRKFMTSNPPVGDSVEWGTPQPYGRTHQMGKNARPFLGLSSDNIEEINYEAAEFMKKVLL